MKRRFFVMGTALLMVLTALLAGCGNKTETKPAAAPAPTAPATATPAPATAKKLNVGIATANATGTSYSAGNHIAQVLSKAMQSDAAFSAMETKGSSQNADLLKTKDAEMAIMVSGPAYDAYNGTGASAKNGPNHSFYYLASLYQNVAQIVVPVNSSIKSPADLKGKKVAVGEKGSGSEQTSREIMDVYGIDWSTRKDLDPQFISGGDASDALKDGHIDAMIYGAGIPTSVIVELCNTGKFRLLPYDADKMKDLQAKYPWYSPMEIPANTYKGQDKVVIAPTSYQDMVIRADLPDDFVYKVTKALVENAKEIAGGPKTLSEFSKEFAVKGKDLIPVHPGALKYYREVGLIK